MDLIEEIKKLLEKVDELEAKNTELSKMLLDKEIERDFAEVKSKRCLRKIEETKAYATPVKVFHSKSRKNTTVKFMDGSSETVHLMKGDKDCLYTAVVYALVKHLYNKKLIENLVKQVTETGGTK